MTSKHIIWRIAICLATYVHLAVAPATCCPAVAEDPILAVVYLTLANPAYEDCPHSELIREALYTPLDDLQSIHPENEELAVYLNRMRILRNELSNFDGRIERTLLVQTRENAGADSSITLPEYSFSRLEAPVPLLNVRGPSEIALFDGPLAVLEHLNYLVQLRRSSRGRRFEPELHNLTFGHLEVLEKRSIDDYNKYERQVITWEPNITPHPWPVELELKVQTIEIWTTDLGGFPLEDVVDIRTHTVQGIDDQRAIELLDMGTGLLTNWQPSLTPLNTEIPLLERTDRSGRSIPQVRSQSRRSGSHWHFLPEGRRQGSWQSQWHFQ